MCVFMCGWKCMSVWIYVGVYECVYLCVGVYECVYLCM